jgi:hypothetical protein
MRMTAPLMNLTRRLLMGFTAVLMSGVIITACTGRNSGNTESSSTRVSNALACNSVQGLDTTYPLSPNMFRDAVDSENGRLRSIGDELETESKSHPTSDKLHDLIKEFISICISLKVPLPPAQPEG